jgi:LacI family gluconate utilization system Gnt-I transcriptional repressor
MARHRETIEPASMADVARRAGVSLSTVSRVIRMPELVAAPTRQRIQQALAETGYVPNLVAASLKSEQTGLVGCVVPSVEHSFVAEVVRGAGEVLRPLGFHLLLATSDFSTTEEEEVVRTFLSRRPDAMILTGLTHTPHTSHMLRTARIPVVEVGNLTDTALDMVVGFSNSDAQHDITLAMIETGRRRIGYLLHDSPENERSRDRHVGYRRALTEHGLAAGPTVKLPFSYRGGREGIARVLEADPACDGICCSNDVLAQGALFELQRRGIPVPGAIAVAGFDEHDASAECIPPLGTVSIPRWEMGRQAGLMIAQTLAGERPAARCIDVGYTLIRRATF